MKFCIRVDDFGFLPDKSRDSGLEFARAFHDAMAGAPYMAAAIPGCMDEDGLAWLDSNPKGMMIAMHGCLHQQAAPGENSEFYGKSYRQCLTMLREARKMMPLKTEHFAAPWDHYTESLHEALSVFGFNIRWMGAEQGAKPTRPTGRPCVRIPGWRPLCGALGWKMDAKGRELMDVFPELLQLPGRAVMGLHVTWEGSRGIGFEGVRELVNKFRAYIISPEQYLEKSL